MICHIFFWALNLKFNCYNTIDVWHMGSCKCEIVYWPLSASSKSVFTEGEFFDKKASLSSATHFRLCVKFVKKYLKVFRTYRSFCHWNVIFYGLSWSLFNFWFGFLVYEDTNFIFLVMFFHTAINIDAKFLVQ